MKTIEEIRLAISEWVSVDPNTRGAFFVATTGPEVEHHEDGAAVGGRADLIGMAVMDTLDRVPIMQKVLKSAVEIHEDLCREKAATPKTNIKSKLKS